MATNDEIQRIAKERVEALYERSRRSQGRPLGWHVWEIAREQANDILCSSPELGGPTPEEHEEWLKWVKRKLEMAGIEGEDAWKEIGKPLREHLDNFYFEWQFSLVLSKPNTPLLEAMKNEKRQLSRVTKFVQSSPFIDDLFKEEAGKQLAINKAALDMVFPSSAQAGKKRAKSKGIEIGERRRPWASKNMSKAILEVNQFLVKKASKLTKDSQRFKFIAAYFNKVYSYLPGELTYKSVQRKVERAKPK